VGTGAGTFRFSPPPASVTGKQTGLELAERRDAGSVYLETLAELGVPGLAALLVAIGTILVGTVRRARGPDRRVYGVALAAIVLWTAHVGVDIGWKLPALTLWVFALAGLVLSAPVTRADREQATSTR
jgi:O-antigen ligase